MCDLPARRHAQASRPDHQGRRMSSHTAAPFRNPPDLPGSAAASPWHAPRRRVCCVWRGGRSPPHHPTSPGAGTQSSRELIHA
ncbi:hypothetical protein DAA51_18020 [Bradyrhizobium sp. WBAH10]|nr:hypothetical protein [Bradyrhizobium sp. WBAH30]MDD1540787.1 hypothetical protein [Bradyrhizobium sp. WBAH41]MDD1555767.1 hypothetical protein [Bradyrhizobium sp. WBAH23]MDD1563422.1 hypothetical protein [Bradyrhizobium sp. WBAH33]MDD1588075.1 hypothetical protein [Bradyrhizobium sp. WBAH42]NRB86480.1 hypothetical protein [Bradyrhizobium sp. WBAH10]QCJ90219.1 hypothetical protein DAA57_18210 [Bradyrhizobium yuanmingense]